MGLTPRLSSVFKSPTQSFLIAEAAVCEHDQSSLQLAQGFPIHDECSGNLPHTVDAAGQQGAIFDEPTNLAHFETEHLGQVGNCQPLHIG